MRSWMLAVVVLSAVPCIASGASKDPAKLVATHGYAYMSFSKGGQDTLAVSPVGSKSEIRISMAADVPAVAKMQAIGDWLPAGSYRITGWGGLKWKNGPTFEIKPGRVTDLGDYVAVDVGGYNTVMLPIAHASRQDAVAAASRIFASQLVDPAPIPMDMAMSSPMERAYVGSGLGLVGDLLIAHDRRVNKPSTINALLSARDPDAFLRLARTVTLPVQDEPASLPDGTLYFPADFGQLRKRTPDGHWSNVGMDTLRQITSVEADDGRLVAGSDDGHIRESRDGGATWMELVALGSKQSVLDIDHTDGYWVVTTLENTDPFKEGAIRVPNPILNMPFVPRTVRLRILVARADDLADLKPSREFAMDINEMWAWPGPQGQLVNGDYYVLAGNTPQRLNLASGQWKAIPPRARTSTLRVNPTTGVVSALWGQGAFSKVYYSTDKGDTWQQIGRPPYVIWDVQMDTATSGWASRWNMNAFGGDWELYSFSSQKNDWDHVGDAPFNCRPMRVSTQAPVFCMTRDSSIFSLRDGKWSVEFSAQ